MYKKISILVLTIGMFVIPTAAGAVGLAVSPSSLDISAEINEEVTRILTVENDSTDVSLFEAYIDNFDEVIKIRPASFILESGEKQSVAITVDDDKNEVLSTNVSIISRAITDSAFNAYGGVKIPLTVTVTKTGGVNPFTASIGTFMGSIYAIVFGLLAIIAVFIVRFKRVSKRTI